MVPVLCRGMSLIHIHIYICSSYLRTEIDMSTPNPFKVSAYAIDTAMPSGRQEQLHGRPSAVTNVHLGTELVYTGPPPDWKYRDPPLPCPPWTRLWVTKMDTKRRTSVYDYLLENNNHTFTCWLSARHLVRYINRHVFNIIPRAKIDVLRPLNPLANTSE